MEKSKQVVLNGSTGGYIYYGPKGGGSSKPLTLMMLIMQVHADVNMSVGALDAVAYNEIKHGVMVEVASSGLADAAYAFDGSPNRLVQSALGTNVKLFFTASLLFTFNAQW